MKINCRKKDAQTENCIDMDMDTLVSNSCIRVLECYFVSGHTIKWALTCDIKYSTKKRLRTFFYRLSFSRSCNEFVLSLFHISRNHSEFRIFRPFTAVYQHLEHLPNEIRAANDGYILIYSVFIKIKCTRKAFAFGFLSIFMVAPNFRIKIKVEKQRNFMLSLPRIQCAFGWSYKKPANAEKWFHFYRLP